MTHSFSDDDIKAYVSGAASRELAAQVDAHLLKDPGLRAEVALTKALLQLAAEETAEAPPDELGWRRLETAIRAEDAALAQPTPAAMPRYTIWRAAAVVFGIIILGQGAYIATAPGTGDPARFETASGTQAGHVLGVAFTEGATAAEITALLRAQNGQITDGPSALGLYRVEFESDDAMAAAREVLAGSDLVQLVAEE